MSPLRLFFLGFLPVAGLLVPLSMAGDPPLPQTDTLIMPLPPIDRAGPVTDAAQVLEPPDREKLGKALVELRRDTGIAFDIVTLPSDYGLPRKRLSFEMRVGWPVGSAEENDGMVLVLMPNEGVVVMEGGDGLPEGFDQAFYSRVIDDMIPELRRGNVVGAMRDAIVSVRQTAIESRS